MSDLGQSGVTFDLPKNQSSEIKVIGVGGGGSNAVNYMFEQGIKGVDFVVCNTDAQALTDSPIPNKIQLGVTLTEGLGAGANPEIGQKSAMESLEEVKSLLGHSTKMVFVTAGMGGGTGTGAAPIIAKTAKEMGILTVGIVTYPFSFEGAARKRQAEEGIEQLRGNVDSLIVVNNDKLRDVYGNLGFKSGFVKANEVLSTAAKGIAEVITQHYRMNIDLNDARTVLADSGTAIMGAGTASGEGRAVEAVSKALDSPLLNDNDIFGCRSVLLLIVSGEAEITLDEIGEISDYVQSNAGGHADVIIGVGEDDTLGESICVTVIATGFDPDQQENIMPGEPTKIVHKLDSEEHAPRVSMDLKAAKPAPAAPLRSNRPVSGAAAPKAEETIRHELIDEDEDEGFTATHPAPAQAPSQPVQVAPSQPAPQAKPQVAPEPEQQVTLSFDLPEAVQQDPEEGESESTSTGVVYHHLLDEEEVEVQPSKAETFEADEPRMELKTKSQPQPDWAQPVSHRPVDPKPVQEPAKLEDMQSANPVEENEAPSTSIAEEQLRRARERKSRLKAFSYNFKNANQVSKAENTPAYVRQGIELDKVPHSGEQKISRYTLGENENNQPTIRNNNSFLHDNVD